MTSPEANQIANSRHAKMPSQRWPMYSQYLTTRQAVMPTQPRSAEAIARRELCSARLAEDPLRSGVRGHAVDFVGYVAQRRGHCELGSRRPIHCGIDHRVAGQLQLIRVVGEPLAHV